jgi:hypothetical protein
MTANPPPIAGFRLDNPPTPSPPAPARPDPTSLRENDELVSDLARFSENILSEKQVRKKWHLFDESTWIAIGKDDLIVEMVEAEQIRRIRNGQAKREKAQNFVTSAPDVLNGIMSNPKESARHRIDASKALNGLADPGPEAAAETEKVYITINLSADTKNPKDILTIEATPRHNPNQLSPPTKDVGSDDF